MNTKGKEWEAYPKTPRLSKCKMVITEKIDGTNGCIQIHEDGSVLAYSRKRPLYAPREMIGPDGPYLAGKNLDNYGFAAWVKDNEASLRACLPVGLHYGEWCGPGIQKNPLGLKKRQFRLFDGYPKDLGASQMNILMTMEVHPVPVLYIGAFSEARIIEAHTKLMTNGTTMCGAEPGSPAEGIIINAFGKRFKRTEGDLHKGENNNG